MAGRGRCAAGAARSVRPRSTARRPCRQRRSQSRQARGARARSARGTRRRAGEIARLAARRPRVLRAQSEKLAAEVNERQIGAARRRGGAVDLSAINERIAELERASRAQSTEIAQENAQNRPTTCRCAASWRPPCSTSRSGSGDPYPAALTAAKALAPNPDALKPLDGFAASGVPSAASAQPRTADAGAETVAAGAGEFHHRLQPGRPPAGRRGKSWSASSAPTRPATIAAPSSRGSPRRRCATIYNEARRELNTLPAADRAAAQAWLDKADARDAALAASRQFAAEAMTALAKPAP